MAKKSSGTKNPATRRGASIGGLPNYIHNTGSTADLSALASAMGGGGRPVGSVQGARPNPFAQPAPAAGVPTFKPSVPLPGFGPNGQMNPVDAYAAEMQAAQEEAKQANEQRYLDILSELNSQRGDTSDRLMSAMENLDQRFDTNARDMDSLFKTARKDTGKRYGDRTKEATRRTDSSKRELDSRYSDRLQNAMSRLRGAGEREAADIRGASKAADSAMSQNMANRGFGNAAGLQESLRMGLGRERNADLGRLGERLRGEEQNVFGRMTGEQLSAAERGNMAGLNAYMQASGDQAGALGNLDAGQISAMERLMNNQTGTAERSLGRYNDALSGLDSRFVNTMENRTDSYPDFGPLLQAAQMAGMGGGFAPQQGGMQGSAMPQAQPQAQPKATPMGGRMQNPPGAPPRRPKPTMTQGAGGSGGGLGMNMPRPGQQGQGGLSFSERPNAQPAPSMTPQFAPGPMTPDMQRRLTEWQNTQGKTPGPQTGMTRMPSPTRKPY